ncbi:MAG: hypothetical protein ABI315_14510 [Bacteroidia bacterium]
MRYFKKGVLLASCCTLLMLNVNNMTAQEREDTPLDTLTNMQPQWQYIDSAGAPSLAGGDFSNAGNPYYSRFTMRRMMYYDLVKNGKYNNKRV